MAMANGVYGITVKKIINQSAIDYASDTIRVAIVKDSHTPDFDTHNFLDDIPTTDRAKTGTGWNQTLVSTVDLSAANDKIYFSSGVPSVSWTNVTLGVVVSGMVVYKSSGADTTSPLICLCSFVASVTAGQATVTVNLNANGVMQASYQT